MKFTSPAVMAKIRRRGISEEDIAYCLEHSTQHYQHRVDTVHVSTLLDGRHIKVAIRPGSEPTIANAIVFQ
jgi:hypothetical protein